MASLGLQLGWLLLLALPIACISWTVTHEEIFREPREFCERQAESARHLLARKFFYVFTCEYCFSHYVTAAVVALTGYQLLFPDWRGYVLGGFALVWIANAYMSAFALLRLSVKGERLELKQEEKKLEEGTPGPRAVPEGRRSGSSR